jgi:hypothetical protein
MPRYFTAHVITCMSRQDLQKLVRQLHREAVGPVRLLRVQCDTLSGRMVCEWEAEEQEKLVEWLARRSVRFRSHEEWIFRVQYELRDGDLSAT